MTCIIHHEMEDREYSKRDRRMRVFDLGQLPNNYEFNPLILFVLCSQQIYKPLI